MARITLVTNGHFCSNPRVWKEADALAAGGHDVSVVGIWHDEHQAELDVRMAERRQWRHVVAADMRSSHFKGRFTRTWLRLQCRTAKALAARGVQNPNALGYAANHILRSAVSEDADLTIGHLELGMWVAGQLANHGKRVGVDIEDWHSENLPDGPSWQAQQCRQIETRVLGIARHVTTTSHAMSEAIAREFRIRRPEVIYNGNHSGPCDGVPPRGAAKIVWFSQTIGRGRGLEDAFLALPLLRGEWSLEVIGAISAETRAWMVRQMGPEIAARVTISPPVPPTALREMIDRHDIGLALEQPCCISRDLTITNKIIQYLQCGLKVAATGTAGQREALALVPNGGAIYSAGDSAALANILNQWIATLASARGQRQLICASANACFAYELGAPKLLSSVESALHDPT